MDERNHFPQEPWEKDSYETGRTKPPKNRRGLIALLLVAVVFLGGISSALGIMNIKLFRHLKAVSGSSGGVVFHEPTEQGLSFDSTDYVRGREVSAMEQRWYRMPAGFLLTGMTQGGTAEHLGLQMSDVVVSVNDVSVRDADTLMGLLRDIYGGQEGILVLYRQGQLLTLNIPAGERP